MQHRPGGFVLDEGARVLFCGTNAESGAAAERRLGDELDRQRGRRSASVLAIVGAVNLPIIKFSVDWWNTLHQPASLTRMDGPAIHPAMLTPLLLMITGFTVYFAAALLQRMRCEILERERDARWLLELDAP